MLNVAVSYSVNIKKGFYGVLVVLTTKKVVSLNREHMQHKKSTYRFMWI